MFKLKEKLRKSYLYKLLFNKNIDNKSTNFPGSKKYWEARYVSNRDSGSGSYGRLAEFKAEILNKFVKDNNIQKIVELGCGDGNQLSLAKYPTYIGLDVSNKALEICRNLFKSDNTKEFYNMNEVSSKEITGDLVMSLDVIYHLIEDDVFHDYMTKLFNYSSKYVIIYSSNYYDHFAEHVKCRKFTDWIEKNVSKEWKSIGYIKNIYPFNSEDPDNTSMADFYIYEKISS